MTANFQHLSIMLNAVSGFRGGVSVIFIPRVNCLIENVGRVGFYNVSLNVCLTPPPHRAAWSAIGPFYDSLMVRTSLLTLLSADCPVSCALRAT